MAVELKKSESALLSRIENIGKRAEYDRQYYLKNKDKKAEYCLRNSAARAVYRRQYDREYNSQNKDKNAEYRNRNDESRAEYHRQYNLQNKDKNAEVRARNDGMTGYYRQYYLQRKDKNPEFRTRNVDSRVEYHRQYNLLNKDKNAEYRARKLDAKPGYHRHYYLRNKDKNPEYRMSNGDSRVEYRRQYYLQNADKNADYRAQNDRTDYLQQYSLGKKEFNRSAHGYLRTNLSWKTPDLVREYFESVASQLNISTIGDWYRISKKQLDQYKGSPLCNKFGNLGTALQYAYPEIQWDLSVFGSRGKKKAGQRWLKMKIKELLPGTVIIEDFLHPDLNWDDSDRKMELDLWIPQYGIGIEFQGEQHYTHVDVFGPSTGAYWERDILKNNLCATQGITLVVIPYWWDGEIASLSATLYQTRPDVFPVSDANPIPREKPISLAKCYHPSADTSHTSISTAKILDRKSVV